MASMADLLSKNVNEIETNSYAVNQLGLISILDYRNGSTIFDGATSAVAALNLAIADLPTLGGTIFFPSTENGSTYLIDSNVTIPANCTLKFPMGARIKRATGIDIFSTSPGASIEAGKYTIFTGTGNLTGTWNVKEWNVEWFGASVSESDNSTYIQDCLDTANSNGTPVINVSGRYIITESIVPLVFNTTTTKYQINGKGRYDSYIINKCSAGKPTFVLSALENLEFNDIGIVGFDGFPNYGVSITGNSNNIRFNRCWLRANGNSLYISFAHSIFLRECSGTFALSYIHLPGAQWTNVAGSAWIYLDITAGLYANHIIIRDCMNEGELYQIYTNQAGDGYANNILVEGCQLEGSVAGIYLKECKEVSIKNNYMGEGSTYYDIEVDACRAVEIQNNYHNYTGYQAKQGSIKINNCTTTKVTGRVGAILLSGTSLGVVFERVTFNRILDITSDKMSTFIHCVNSDIPVENNVIDIENGSSVFYGDDTVAKYYYPYLKRNSKFWKDTPASGASPGWVCTTAPSMGALVQTTGTGTNPGIGDRILNAVTLYDYRITCTTGGYSDPTALQTQAVFKVEYKTAGGGVYADLLIDIDITELGSIVGTAPLAYHFMMYGTSGALYTLNDEWTLTAVVAQAWTAMANLA